MTSLLLVALAGAVQWQHPAGLVTDRTISEIRGKLAAHEWARIVYQARKQRLQLWVDIPFEDLEAAFPKKRGNVYHNFSCPYDRTRLDFQPFQFRTFRCLHCGREFDPGADSGIYSPGDRYHGTLYDGWACLFYLTASAAASDMALIGRIDNSPDWTRRAVEMLALFATTVESLPTEVYESLQFNRILTYHREGDNKILCDLATAYELVRDDMTDNERRRFEQGVLTRMLDDVMWEPVYKYDHNNVYQWHRTILQTALALEREDLIDWSFGYNAYDPDRQPDHRSIRRILATHFKPDGAFWELCSGYHLYPLTHLCDLAVLSRNVARMDRRRFPARDYDLTHRDNPAGKTIRGALEWFLSMAMPDRSMPVVGDSTAPRAGMDSYAMTAEVGYRYFNVTGVGDYADLREGRRTWVGLLYGAPEIVQRPTPFTSSFLSSGWVSLRNEWCGNRVWVGLNALEPGGGHQHADRLTLVNYAHGKLLALEKATPYNESVTRVLGTLSPSHNTVTVDGVSQKQGESLSEHETPRVALFFGGPVATYAELHADAIYPQTRVYRRSVALIEDIAVDLFRVEGGRSHDWMVHHAGGPPELSVPMQDGTFEPSEWLYNGTQRVMRGATDGTWTSQWKVDDVTSRVTMLGAEGTEVYALETYPVDNAVVTEQSPPCQSLCVRRTVHAPFLAVWDSWRVSPNLLEISEGSGSDSLMIRTVSSTYYVKFGPGRAEFSDGTAVDSDSNFAVVRNRDAALFAHGTFLAFSTPDGDVRLAVDGLATLCAIRDGRKVDVTLSGDIQYTTYNGADQYCTPPDVRVVLDGSLWRGAPVVNTKRATRRPHTRSGL